MSMPVHGEPPRISIVIPAYREGENIEPCLDRIIEAVDWPAEILVVLDFEQDETAPVLERYSQLHPSVRTLINTYGRGPANAIRYGFDHSRAHVVVVTMADGSDDPEQIVDLARLVERGVVVAAASRYAPGGQQVGGPLMKSLLSRTAGKSLHLLAHMGTRDATNSFKAYDREFVQQVGIDSRHGFEIGLELAVKAKRLRRPIAEIPTIWLDRDLGESNFDMWKWIPKYVHWYRRAFGKAVDIDGLRRVLPPADEDELARGAKD